MITDVAALYVMADGPYPKLVADWYDEKRDAKLYDGPFPVVAHPPCGPWGRLRFMCTKQDATCAPRAVEQVRAFGGVLEHPAHSRLWSHCDLPLPWGFPDRWGGRTYPVNQVAWGHLCKKPTWLYVVGVDPEVVVKGILTGGIAKKQVCNHMRNGGKLPSAGKRTLLATPPLFASWLLSLAGQSHAPRRL